MLIGLSPKKRPHPPVLNLMRRIHGQYVTVSGIVWNVDTAVSHTILLGDKRIRFTDIVSIESDHRVYDPRLDEDQGIFDNSWEVEGC